MIFFFSFFFFNMILFYTFLPWKFRNVFEIIYFFAQKKKKDELSSLNKGHSALMFCLCTVVLVTKNERVWKRTVLTFYHQYTDLSFSLNIYQITVISVAIQNI